MREYIYGRGGCRILLVHGWMHSSRLYEKLAAALARRHTVHALDLPGFGDSPPVRPEGPLLDAFTLLMERYLAETDFDVIVAHSLGAAVMLRVLARAEAPPAGRVILCNPAYLGIARLCRLSSHTRLSGALIRLAARLPLRVAQPFIKLASLLTINSYALVDDIVVSDVRRADPLTAGRLLRELCGDIWRFPGKRCDCEVSVLLGENDRLIARGHAESLCRSLGCALDIIPSSGHTPVVESFAFLYAYIRDRLPHDPADRPGGRGD